MTARLMEVIAVDVYCGNWGLNPCLVVCDDCQRKAAAAMQAAGIPDRVLWESKDRREHDEAVVKAAKRILKQRETAR